MKRLIGILSLACLAILSAQTLWAAEEPAAETQGVESTVASEPTPAVAPGPEIAGVGVCLGQGAGLIGAYVKVNPIDHLGFEAAVGKRMFMFLYNDDIEVYWPTAAAVKARYYFFERAHRINLGMEAGGMYAEDLGMGGEVSGVFTFRINRHLHLDASLGAGYMPDAKNKQLDYLVSVRGRTRSYYENNADVVWNNPFMLFWGIGFAFMF
jgi:hypothetical protein